MTDTRHDTSAPRAARPEWDGPVSREEFMAKIKHLEEEMAYLADKLGTQLDELAFGMETSRVDSNTTQRQIGVDEAFIPFRHGR